MRQISISIANFARIWALRIEGENTEDDILSRVLVQKNTGALVDREALHSANSTGEGKMRWVDDIVMALRRLGGEATLHDIYRITREMRLAGGRSIPPTFEAVVRRTLEDHSSDSANHRADDLFRISERGVWALR